MIDQVLKKIVMTVSLLAAELVEIQLASKFSGLRPWKMTHIIANFVNVKKLVWIKISRFNKEYNHKSNELLRWPTDEGDGII